MVKHVVLANVLMEGITDSNKPPNTFNRRQAAEKGALKISKESDDFIFGEIYRRDKLEDPEYEDEDDSIDIKIVRVVLNLLQFLYGPLHFVSKSRNLSVYVPRLPPCLVGVIGLFSIS